MNKHSWRKRSMSAADLTGGDLPIFNPASAAGRRESSTSSEVTYKLIHLIPLVVMACFFILWCFSSPVDMETKDGRTIFVPRAKNKKSPQTSESTDLDLTVLALESPPDGFLSVSDGPYASVALVTQPNVSHDHNSSLSVVHDLKAPFSISQEPSATFSDLHEPNELSVDLHESNASFAVSDEPRLDKGLQQASEEG
ncbi:uncharacterized protein LOC143609434 [Bidens hawaiensis]|uniref:uncharacterized protein LOC143609434 n=1 Tax=Bidens hawaiensis TaxID=980011 RepID=UPI00404AA1CC